MRAVVWCQRGCCCQDQHTLPKWNILSSCYCGLLSLLPKWNILSSCYCRECRKMLLWLALSARMCVLACQDQNILPKWNILSSCYCRECRKMLLWLALSARMCVLACQDQHTLPKWNILSSCYCGLLSLLVCVYWPARTSTPSQSEIFSQAVIVACSLCSYVCIGLPGPAHPPKVKYSLKAIFVVSVERSNTAYNSLHINCIGFMSWVSKDQTQHTIVYT